MTRNAIGSLFLAILAAVLLAACAAAEPAPGHITVTGIGQASGEPDEINLVFGMWSKDASPAAAMLNSQAKLDAVAAALAGLGIDAAAMEVVGRTINSESVTGPDGYPTDQLLYAVNEIRSVTLPNAEAIAPALDAIRNIAGAPYLFSQNVNYEMSAAQRAALAAEAEANALADAQARAERLAARAGAAVGPPADIKVVGDAAPSLPWQVQVTVEVTYPLEGE